MSKEIHNLQRIAVTEETTANFGTDLTGSATYYDIPFQEGSAQLQLNKPQLETQEAQQYIDGRATTILGPASATLSFSMVLAPNGTAANASTASLTKTDSGLMMLLYLVYGGINAGKQGSLVATGTSSTVFDVTASEGTQFAVGQAVGLPTGASGAYEIREITSISSDTITLKYPLTAAPSTSDIVLNATTIYPEDDPTSSAQLIVEGVETSDRWVLMGGQCTSPPSITRNNGELPTISFSMEFADYSSLTAAAITAATYSNFSPVYTFGEFFAQRNGVSTRQVLDVGTVSYQHSGPTYVKQMSPSGTNTVARWRRNRAIPFCKTTFSLPYEDTTWFTARDSSHMYHLMDQIGNTGGGMVAIVSPTAQIVDAQRTAENSMAYQTVVADTKLDDEATDKSTALRRAAHRIHFL